MAGIVVKPRARLFHGHEWVYASEVQKTFGDPQPGDVVTLKDFKDRPLGSGIYNPQSQIVVRRLSRRKQDLDLDFFRRRLRRALDHRASLGIELDLARLVWSESDGLPGVVVDRYGSCLVVQTLTLGMDRRKDLLTEALAEILSPSAIIERNDSSMRTAEGLPSKTGVLRGQAPEPFEIESGGIVQQVDLMKGQKTGFYLDQLENHQLVASLAAGKRVLDVFAHLGGFALACKKAGAAEAMAVEISESAVAAGRAAAARNGLDVTFEQANAFDALRSFEREGRTFDLIILDPPSFTRSKKALQDALRGYKEIHLRALRLLDTGGRLATFSCSHHVTQPVYTDLIASASVDAKKTLRRVAVYSQRADHPVIATIPETEYLRGYAVETIAAW